MISKEQFLKLTVKYQTTQLNTARDYLQHLFLNYFYQLPESSGIYFKGGTALRIIYQSARFSEDLDFSTNHKNVPGIEDSLLEVLDKIEKENIQATLKEAKTTTDGYLSIIEFIIFDMVIPVQIEISFREKKDRGETVVITSDFIPSYTVVALVSELLIGGKMKALLDRKKPRDFYDLYFILRKQLPILNKKTVLAQVQTDLRVSKINFDVELKQFLPKSHWIIIKDFKQTLKREIERSI